MWNNNTVDEPAPDLLPQNKDETEAAAGEQNRDAVETRRPLTLARRRVTQGTPHG